MNTPLTTAEIVERLDAELERGSATVIGDRQVVSRSLVKEAASALLALEGELAETRKANAILDPAAESFHRRMVAAEAELAKVREALKPFANLAADYLADTVNFDDDTIMAGRIVRRGEEGTPPRVTFADFRRARAALSEKTV
jgi:hypothetical protein